MNQTYQLARYKRTPGVKSHLPIGTLPIELTQEFLHWQKAWRVPGEVSGDKSLGFQNNTKLRNGKWRVGHMFTIVINDALS